MDGSLKCIYPSSVEKVRRKEYPQLKGFSQKESNAIFISLTTMIEGTTYLDHAGTTLYPRTLVKAFSKDMKANVFGNPHSQSPSSILSTYRIESARARLLQFFKADPEHFDLIFVANATAAIKLVVDCIVDFSKAQSLGGFWYGYHADCHTSLVGPREMATNYTYFESDEQVESWINSSTDVEHKGIKLFAFPGQSNMTGRRLPLDWSGRLRLSPKNLQRNTYTLLDAAALASTTQIDLSNYLVAPDFTALSLYKIFGFPDLGALLVRKDSSQLLTRRRYFGGGTVDMVINGSDTLKSWCAKKHALHERLEDGTPPFHSIIALGWALKVHERLYGSMADISRYTCSLSKVLLDGMMTLKHTNGRPVCKVYSQDTSAYGDPKRQGPTIAFNVMDSAGGWIGKSDVEKLAVLNNIQLRSGGVCNPGGIAAALDLSPSEMKDNFAEGLRCGNDIDVLNGKPTGIVRVSLGAMSTIKDIEAFLTYLTIFIDSRGHSEDSIPGGAPIYFVWKKSVSAGDKGTINMVCVSEKDIQTDYPCPVGRCREILKSRSALDEHFQTHKIGSRKIFGGLGSFTSRTR